MARIFPRKYSATLFATLFACTGALAHSSGLHAEPNTEKQTRAPKIPNEDVLGEFIVTGTVQEHIPKIAILPSLSPALEDVIVRSVIRRDLELSGMFRVIPDKKAPVGQYGFDDPVNVKPWQSLGAEAIVKVAARSHKSGKIEVIGLAYFPSVGEKPVYETRLLVSKTRARKTAHQITDDLLGALTGRPGGFSSRFAFTGPWGRNQRVFTVDSDGHGLEPQSDEKVTTIGPSFGPEGRLFYSQSRDYSPFRVFSQIVNAKTSSPLGLGFSGSVYSSTFDKKHQRIAVAVAENGKSSIYVGATDGSPMKRVSKTVLATHPVFSPEGQLAWVGGSPERTSQRVYVDGKPVSPNGFTASAPTFCDTEDGIFLVYAVAVGGGRQDLILSRPNGKGLTRLTQNQGSNSYPACSPDGRLLAFFSTRKAGKGLYVMSLKRWTTKKIRGGLGESLRWAPLPRSELTDTGSPRLQSLIKTGMSGPACGLAPSPE